MSLIDCKVRTTIRIRYTCKDQDAIITKQAGQSLNGDGDTHRIYSAKCEFIIIYVMDPYHKRKKVLEEKHGKSIA